MYTLSGEKYLYFPMWNHYVALEDGRYDGNIQIQLRIQMTYIVSNVTSFRKGDRHIFVRKELYSPIPKRLVYVITHATYGMQQSMYYSV